MSKKKTDILEWLTLFAQVATAYILYDTVLRTHDRRKKERLTLTDKTKG